MRIKTLVTAVVAVVSMFPIVAQAETTDENPWMVRVRAVDILFKNDQTNALSTLNVEADDKVIPELDVSYFFTKNIAAELVLTWPQKVSVMANGANIGEISALPPSLLVQYHFTDLGVFKPYVGAGINYTSFSDRHNFPALNDAITVDKSSFGFVAQIGMDYMLNKNWGLNADLKYAKMNTEVKAVDGSANLGKLTLDPWMPSVGVTYKF